MDVLLHRYTSIDFVMNLPLEIGAELINKAIEKTEESLAWDMWLERYQHMDEKTFVPFSQFHKTATKTRISQKPTQDILADAGKIRQLAGIHKPPT